MLLLRNLVLFAPLTWALPEIRAQGSPPEIGQPAYAFTLQRLDGGRLDLADLRSRPVVINFWATWCVPCRTEMPLLISAWHAHRSSAIEIVAVNLTDQERRKDIGRFVEEMRMPFPVLLDEKGRVRERYALTTLPTTVFVDSSGIVRAVHPGPISAAALARGLGTILPPSTAPRSGGQGDGLDPGSP